MKISPYLLSLIEYSSRSLQYMSYGSTFASCSALDPFQSSGCSRFGLEQTSFTSCLALNPQHIKVFWGIIF